MKLIFLLCGLLAVALAASRHNLQRAEQLPRAAWIAEAEPFRSGKSYQFRYESQIASGLGSLEQQSAHRISASVHVNFDTDRVATLQIKQIRLGSLNQPIEEPSRLQSARLFDDKQIEAETMDLLEMPLKFDYVDGVVERVYFHSKETSWTKNMKRAVLNMLQLNLKQRESAMDSTWESRINEEDSTSESSMFTIPEMTLEGECQTLYTINKVQQQGAEEQSPFNVTKSINFDSCKQLAVVRYGPRSLRPVHQQQPSQAQDEQLKTRQMERSTVLRYQLIGSPERYAIGQVQILSQYSYQVLETAEALRTVVVAELQLEKVESGSRKAASVKVDSKHENLMYSMEFDVNEQCFYQLGDEEFPRESSPFAKVQNKAQIVVDLVKKIAVHSHDKTNGITSEAPLKVQELVEMLRMCSLRDLKVIYEQVEASKTQKNVLIDALSIAGTYNSVYFLVQATLKAEITPAKAVQALQQIHSVPAPSNKMIEQLFTLCQSSVAERSQALQQACWLASGSLIGDLCKDTLYSSEEKRAEGQCPRELKEKFLRTYAKQLKQASTQYEKIVLLKAIGNAALDLSVYDLEKVITNAQEDTLVRQQAIDSLRRLRDQMPRKIQKILLPVFKNVQEKPEIRMTCFAMIMYTMPEQSVLDQVTYVLLNERSQHVKSFVYSTMKALSRSPVQQEQALARALESCLFLAKVDGQQLKSSRFYRIPVYSAQQGEGVMFNLASIFSSSNMLPSQLAVSMDSVFNGLLEKNNFELSFAQKDIERFYQQIYNVYSSSKNLRGNRRSEETGRNLLENVFDALKIQPRRESASDKTPLAFMTLRIRDLDQVVVPLSEETMPEILRDLIKGEKPSFSTILRLLEGERFKLNSVSSLHERAIKLATSAGFPLKMTHALPLVASVEGQIKAGYQAGELKAQIHVQPMFAAVHSVKMELWCPMMNVGVETIRTVELNLPIESEALFNADRTDKFALKIKLPQEKSQLLAFSSLPMTFVRHFDSRIQLHKEPQVKTIKNPEMDSRIVELASSEEEGRRSSVSVNGLIHKPSELTFEQLVSILVETENHVTVDFEPLAASRSPKELQLTLSGSIFNRIEKTSHRPRFDSFYTSNKFESKYSDDLEDASVEADNDREEKLTRYTTKYEPSQVYDHSVKAEFRTIGGSSDIKASVQLTGACDNKMTFCRFNAQIKRTPYSDESSRDWTLTSKGQVMLPERVEDIQNLDREDSEHNRLVMTLESEWGSEQTQRMSVKLQGERLVPAQWTRCEWRRQLMTAFLNKFDLVADYELNQWTEKRFSGLFEWFKIAHTWNQDSDKLISGRDSHVFISAVIDPRTRQHVNITVKTPSQASRFTNIELPFAIKPYSLIRQSNEVEIDSVEDLFEHVSESARDSCRVDGQRVRTFDQVVYKAPIHQCYSVIAKDCSNKKSFAVLIKAVDEESKKLKVVSQDSVIEVESVDSKLAVQVDGRRIRDPQDMEEYNIQYSPEAVVIRLPQGVSVRFDGQQATVKASRLYKNAVCGLCGNYDEDSENEFRMNDDTETDDLKAFHKSYSMLEDSECQRRQPDSIYEQDALFERESARSSRFQDEEESGFESDEETDEYQLFGRKQNNQRRGNEQERDSQDEQTPVKRTEIIEYGHKICFSLKAVKKCPKNTMPETTEQDKVQFTCLNRSSSDARHFLRQARYNDITSKLSAYKTSFVDTVRIHTTCSQQSF